jgi:hypothetical protein
VAWQAIIYATNDLKNLESLESRNKTVQKQIQESRALHDTKNVSHELLEELHRIEMGMKSCRKVWHGWPFEEQNRTNKEYDKDRLLCDGSKTDLNRLDGQYQQIERDISLFWKENVRPVL